MAEPVALTKHDLFEMGWKALVAELGVANATRFVVELSEGEGDYMQVRRELFRGQSVDDLCDAIEDRRRSRAR